MSIQDSRMAHLFYPFLTVFGVKCPFFHEWHLLFFCSLDSLFNLAFPLKKWMDVVSEKKKGIWPSKLQLIRVLGSKVHSFLHPFFSPVSRFYTEFGSPWTILDQFELIRTILRQFYWPLRYSLTQFRIIPQYIKD